MITALSVKTSARKALSWAFIIWAYNLATPLNAAPAQIAVASAHPQATEAGISILRQGGNAFDAAVAVSAALGVAEPYASGLGGGGFWLLHVAKTGLNVVIDGRERAPLAAAPGMYLDASGQHVPEASLNGPKAAAIPGAPAALAWIAGRYGQLALKKSLQPAIDLANQGFVVEEKYHRMVTMRLDALRQSSEAARLFLRNGDVPALGECIRQPELGVMLKTLALQGADGFYRGIYAQHLVARVQADGGIWTEADLRDYQIVERKPLVGHYREWTVIAPPLPSSGGTVLIESLNILRYLPWERAAAVDRMHYTVEAMRWAYRDRAQYLGDVPADQVPTRRLLSRAYAKRIARGIRADRATPSAALPPAAEKTRSADNTSHFSIMDSQGNWVSATLSINYPFGAAYVVPGTGLLLNDEMDDFAPPNAQSNGYGLVGSSANAIAPGKRPLSSMTPAFVISPKGVAALGTPGGSRIISMVLLGTQAIIRGEPVAQWAANPRYHHQYLPDEIQLEPDAIPEEEQQILAARGHMLKPLDRAYGNMQVVWRDGTSGQMQAHSDPRGIGSAQVLELAP